MNGSTVTMTGELDPGQVSRIKMRDGGVGGTRMEDS